MAEERDFYADIGYDLPDNAPKTVEGESASYYQHPAGQYFGFIGRLTPKYKDGENKRCEPDTPGAQFSHYMIAFWITNFAGTMDKPVNESVIAFTPDSLSLPDRPLAECYFSIPIYPDPKKQWSLKNLFEDWKLPGHPQYNIITQSPNNPAATVTNFRAFPAYYGLPVKFYVTFKPETDKKSRYVEGKVHITSYEKRVPKDLIIAFEKAVDMKVEAEREKRKAQSGETYTPPAAPETDFGSLVNNAGDTDLEGFLQ